MMSDSESEYTSDDRKPAKVNVDMYGNDAKRARIVHKSKEKAIAASCTEVEIIEGVRLDPPMTRKAGILESSKQNGDRFLFRGRSPCEDSESDMVRNLRKELKLSKRNEKAYQRDLRHTRFELSTFKAIVRQYRKKATKVCNLAMASVTCEDRTVELGNSRLERDLVGVALKSDSEDKETQNCVSYSYIDNVL